MADTRLTADQRNSFIAALLGWTMDAFDYFIVVLVYADIAKTFNMSNAEVAFITTATLLMRPVGALLFGLWADRIGRRVPLMVDVVPVLIAVAALTFFGREATGLRFGTDESALAARS